MRVCTSCGTENPPEARFCLSCGTAFDDSAEAPQSVRKTVTVVFCDLAGSTALGERLDPESLRHVLARYHDEMRTVLERHGGTVEKFIGDAVMAVFGVPVLHEDDALRAVRAAVEMRTALEALNVELARDRGVAIEVRTGVNTGEVVSGDPSAGSSFVTGDAVNVAARLEQAAGPGEILIGETTFRLVRDAVAAEPVEALALKGKSGGVEAYRLAEVHAGAAGVARRLDSPLVGRGAERALLSQAFDRIVQDRACYLFTVLGPAGVGKTRLVSEFVSSVEGDARVVSGRCLPYGEGITFWPVGEVIRDAVGLTGGEPSEEARERVAAVMSKAPDGGLVAERVEQALGLVESTAAAEETFWGIRRFLELLAADGPLVVVLDDLHWAEQTLLDLVEHIADWSRDAPILLLCMARPELVDTRPGWGGGKMNATSILLEPLSELDCDALIANLLGRATLAPDVRGRITDTAEGNPLFVEQMVAMLVDDGLLRPENGRWVPATDLSNMAVPPTIHALLAARLDRLANEERAVIERASVEGKVFHRGAVATLAPESLRERLPSHLMSLVRKELVRPASSEFPGDDAFRFRHILLRDAAYDALPKEVRADLHERFADWLERAAGARLAEYEEIVGYHLEEAYRYRSELGPVDEAAREIAGRAGDRLLAAGRRAMSRGDVSAASTLLERASSLLPEASPERRRALPLLADALRDAGRAGDARSIYEEAQALASSSGDVAVEARARLGLAAVRLVAELDPEVTRDTLAAAERAVEVFEGLGDDEGITRAWFLIVATKFWTGHAAEAEEAFERGVAHALRANDPRLVADALHWLGAISIWGPMAVDEGLRRGDELHASARPGPADAFYFGTRGALLAMLGRFEKAMDLLGHSERILRDLGLRTDLASSHHAAEALFAAGDYEGIVQRLGPGLAILRESGETGLLSTSAGWVADALYELGRFDEADAVARESEEHSTSDDIASEVQWRGIRAKLLARAGETDEAERLGREGVAIAAASDHVTIHAKADLDLAEVLRLCGKPVEAADALQEAIGLYERKGNVAGVARAQRKLEDLGAAPAS